VQTERLTRLLDRYRQAPSAFHATRYWNTYEQRILDEIRQADFNQLRSGKYPTLAHFGFNDTVYPSLHGLPRWRQAVLNSLPRVMRGRSPLPYRVNLTSIREMAFRHCELLGELSGARPIGDVSMSTVGGPDDLFEIKGRQYSMRFLAIYVRYCFARRHIPWHGRETIVELGPGSGYQVELLKKLYPESTILCFDLPAQLYLCEEYLTRALGAEQVLSADATMDWTNLDSMVPGQVHFLGNWQMPLLTGFTFDIFWNAASFGEMEPEIVRNYLSFVLGGARYIYLLQARHGKETTGPIRVEKQTTFNDYNDMMSGYSLVAEDDAYEAHRRMSQSGGYFEAVWKLNA
jgi:putative sugar O-methyltransferase